MSYPPLTTDDLSYATLMELERRLLAATERGQIKWERHSNYFEWASPHGVVELAAEGIKVYDDKGRRHAQYAPPTDALYGCVSARHEAFVVETIDRILADLDAGVTA